MSFLLYLIWMGDGEQEELQIGRVKESNPSREDKTKNMDRQSPSFLSSIKCKVRFGIVYLDLAPRKESWMKWFKDAGAQ